MSSSQSQVIAGPRNAITAAKILQEINKSSLKPVDREGMKVDGKKNTVVEGYDFTVNRTDVKMLNVTNCQNLTIRRCKFRDKDTLGVALNITGASTKRDIVEYCLFENLTYNQSNGGEPCRLGDSQHSACAFEAVETKC